MANTNYDSDQSSEQILQNSTIKENYEMILKLKQHGTEMVF